MELFGFDVELSEEVYVPREDTYTIVEALEEEIVGGDRVIDVGTGSGVLSFVASRHAKEVVGVDISKKAVDLARKNAAKNGIDNTTFFRSDLFENVEGEFDLVVFNAPYLPKDSRDENIEGSEMWSGENGGLDIVDRFLARVKTHLSKEGRILFLVSSLTGMEKVEESLLEREFSWEIVREKKIPWETLYVVKAWL